MAAEKGFVDLLGFTLNPNQGKSKENCLFLIKFFTIKMLRKLKLHADLDTEIETDENRNNLGKRAKLINQKTSKQ